ncbi:MAG: hypothetical protein IT424_13150 [Pirellulales bacterium]|nr:hypothetical protein [Pirellulales bacterium]
MLWRRERRRGLPSWAIGLAAIAALACPQSAMAQSGTGGNATAAASPTADGPAAAGHAAAGDGAAATEGGEEPVEIAVPLLERSPFDRITLNQANGGAQIETALIDFPNRQPPQPYPTSGTLEIRPLSQPSAAYTVDWSAIAKVELFEQMLLAEAQRLTAANEFAEGFEYFAYLCDHYAKLPGLEAALEAHLWREASVSYAAGRLDEAWPALAALYGRNPRYPRLVNAVQAVSDDRVRARLEGNDYGAARTLVESLASTFKDMPLANVERWREKFRADAEAQMATAQEALAAKQYGAARRAVNYARSIWPEVAGGEELWRRIQAEAPEIRVGVARAALIAGDVAPPVWAATRVAGLVSPRLIEMVDFGAEGGVYASRWGEVDTSDDGLRTAIRLDESAVARGLTPWSLALALAEMGAAGSPHRQEDFAALVRGVGIVDGSEVQVAWQRPHVRPEALLQIPLRRLTDARRSPGLWYVTPADAESPGERRFERAAGAADDGGPRYIVEQAFNSDDEAAAALVSGDVDVLERVPPWQLARLQGAQGIVVAAYRLPTVHVLIPNFANPLLEQREFRRALCYGVNSASIVQDVILGGQELAGTKAVSGPFAAGATLNDPAGYAYNAQLKPRPYEPRLAALLCSLARTTLAKREADEKKQSEGKSGGQTAGSANDRKTATAKTQAEGEPAGQTDAGDESAESLPPLEPLVLVHPADPLARVCCQTIKLQLQQIGIPIKLVEFPGAAPGDDVKYDLLYAELTAWEPVVDARRLLGPGGLAGRCGALMASALDELSRSENWSQAAARLKEIHRIAYYDLPLIPLWQTVNYCAYRRELEGVGDQPVSLYQNVSQWRKSLK